MRTYFCIIFCVLMTQYPPLQAQTKAAFNKEATAFIEQTLTTFPEVPGLSIAVVKGEETLLVKGFGLADRENKIYSDENTLYYIASSTKSFTALAAALLQEKKVLSLQDPITKYFSDVVFDPKLKADQVVIQDLLTHTSGISNDPIGTRVAYTGDHTPEKLYQLLAFSKPNKEAPHGSFEYTNVGYNIFGILQDRLTGKVWQDQLDELVFTPVGMDRTTAYISEAEKKGWPMAVPYNSVVGSGKERIYLGKKDNTMQSAGGMVTSAADVAKWLEVHLNDGKLDGKQIFPAHVIQHTHQSWAETDDSFGPFGRQGGYGLGWYIGSYGEDKMIHHFGGFAGFRSHISFMPDRKLGVAVFVNEGSIGSRMADLIATYVYDWWKDAEKAQQEYPEQLAALRQRGDQYKERVIAQRAEHAKRTWQLSHPLKNYTGTYYSELYGTITIAIEQGALSARAGNLHAISTPYVKKNTIRVEMVPGRGEVIGFELDPNGKATALRYDGEPFERVKEK